MASSVLVFTSMCHVPCPWHFLYFLPLPHGHGSLRPTFGSSRRTVLTDASSPPTRGPVCCPRAGAAAGASATAAPERAPPPKKDGASAEGLFRVMGGGGRRG